MARLNRSLVRWAVLVGILVVSVLFAENPIVTFVLLAILFGLWNVIYLFVIPRARLVGGVAVLLLSVVTFLAAIPAQWVALVAGLLFAHGNWHSFMAAARLDE